MVRRFHRLAKRCVRQGGHVAFEWPRRCSGWSQDPVEELVKELGMQKHYVDGCSYGLRNAKGEILLKEWTVAT
eukprot:10986780-Alexandrium_andersonii.AAC.1